MTQAHFSTATRKKKTIISEVAGIDPGHPYFKPPLLDIQDISTFSLILATSILKQHILFEYLIK